MFLSTCHCWLLTFELSLLTVILLIFHSWHDTLDLSLLTWHSWPLLTLDMEILTYNYLLLTIDSVLLTFHSWLVYFSFPLLSCHNWFVNPVPYRTIWSNFMRMHIDKRLCHFFTVNEGSLLTLILKLHAFFLLLKGPIRFCHFHL